MVATRRLGLAIMAALLIVGLGWSGRGYAQADTLSDAKAQLAQLEQQASELGEQYNQVQMQQTAAQAKLDQTKTDITQQTQKVEDLRSQVAMIALQQFQDQGFGPTAALLSATDLTDALNSFATAQMVAGITDSVLQNFQLQQAALADLQSSETSLVATINDSAAQLQTLKTEADAKVSAQQTVVNRLTAQQQAALAAQQAAAAGTGTTRSGSASSYAPPPPVQNGAAAAQVVAFAYARVGYRYVWGAAGPNAYDCSGLVMAAYASVGISLPHSSQAQYHYGVPVSAADLQPGDLLFFYSGISHVGIYVGNGMMVDASTPSRGVLYRPYTGGAPFVGARRLL